MSQGNIIMQKADHVLLASHGSPGARAAELMAVEDCCSEGAKLHHLIVVPDFWKDMTGDDWLNNGSTRDTYRRYLEVELGKEVDETIERVRQLADSKNLKYQSEIVLGEPGECLVSSINNQAIDLVVVGSARPKGVPGLRSSMITPAIRSMLGDSMVVAPYPHEH